MIVSEMLLNKVLSIIIETCSEGHIQGMTDSSAFVLRCAGPILFSDSDVSLVAL